MGTFKGTKVALAEKLGVSRSSLYYQPKKPPRDAAVKKQIETVMEEHPAYGHRRVAIALGVNHKKAQRIMHRFGLRPAVRRKSRPTKRDDVGTAPSRVTNQARLICPIQPNVLWAGDFTYVWFGGRFWYIATVLDVYAREIVGWHIANHHTTALIARAFTDAVQRTGKTPVWFHSDQGSEYVSGSYADLLKSHSVIASHSTKSSPWQNGFQESFYSNFKLELGNVNLFDTISELIEAAYQQISYYNNRRIHTALKMPPVQFRNMHEQKTALPTCVGGTVR